MVTPRAAASAGQDEGSGESRAVTPIAAASAGQDEGSRAGRGPVDSDGLLTARGVARQLAAAQGTGAALVAGGLAAGLGNAASDIDIYLVGEHLPRARRQLALGHRTVDVHQLPRGELDALARRVLDADLTGAPDSTPVTDADLILATRLCCAQVAAGHGYIAPLLETLPEGKLRRLTIDRWLAAAFTALQDLAGFTALGDLRAQRPPPDSGTSKGAGSPAGSGPHRRADAAIASGGSTDAAFDREPDASAAVLCARSALLASGKAVAAACGDLHDGGKWVFRQLERSAPDRFPLAEFADLIRCDPLGAGGRSIADLAALAQTCLITAATLGWQSVPLSGWPAWTVGDGPLRRAPGFYPRAYEQTLVAAAPMRRSVRMRPDVALVWGLCAGSAQDEVVWAATGLRASAPAYAGLTERRCRAVIARLTASGLVLDGQSVA